MKAKQNKPQPPNQIFQILINNYFSNRQYKTCETLLEIYFSKQDPHISFHNQSLYKTYIESILNQGNYYRAYSILSTSLKSDTEPHDYQSTTSFLKYILAEICLKLDKINEGIEILSAFFRIDNENVDETTVPNGVYGVCLLGRLYERRKDFKKAVKLYKSTLSIEPLLIIPYEGVLKYDCLIYESKEDKENQFNFLEESRVYIELIEKIVKRQVEERERMTIEEEMITEPVCNNNNNNIVLYDSIRYKHNDFKTPKASSNSIKSIKSNYEIIQDNTSNTGFHLNLNEYQSFDNLQTPKIKKEIQVNAFKFKQSSNSNVNSSELISNSNMNIDSSSHTLLGNDHTQYRNINNINNFNNKESSNIVNYLFPYISYIKLLYFKSTFNITLFNKHLSLLDSTFNYSSSTLFLSLKASLLYDINKYTEAYDLFKLAFKKDCSKIENMGKYSSCLWNLKQKSELIVLMNHFLTFFPYSEETWIISSNLFSLLNESHKAIALLERAVMINPYNPYVYLQLGHEFLTLQNYSKANEYYSTAMSVDPNNYLVWFAKGNLYLHQNLYTQAITSLTHSYKINSSSPIICLKIAYAYKLSSSFDKSILFLDKAETEVNDDHQLTVSILKIEVLLLMKKYLEAEKIIKFLEINRKMLITKYGKEAVIKILYGKCLFYMNRFEESRSEFNNSILILNMSNNKVQAGKVRSMMEGFNLI